MRTAPFIAVALAAFIMAGCGGSSSSGGSSPPPSPSPSSAVSPTPSPSPSPSPVATPSPVASPTPTASLTLNGVVTGNIHYVADSDVNDPFSQLVRNNTQQTAQPIPNPAILKGFATSSFTGNLLRQDHFATNDDIFDVYSIEAFAGQSVTLDIADHEIDNPDSVDLDLHLLDSEFNLVAFSELDDSSTEQVRIEEDGLFYIRVFAFSGASNYTLTVSTELASTAYTQVALDRMVPNELILEDNLSERGRLALSSATRQDAAQKQVAGRKQTREALTFDPAELMARMPNDVQAKSGRLMTEMMRERSAGIQSVRSDREAARMDNLLATMRAIKAINMAEGKDVAKAKERPRLFASDPTPDPFIQWNMANVDWTAAQTLIDQAETQRGSPFDYRPVIAVIDSGVFSAHPELSNILVDARDLVPASIDGDGFDAEAEEEVSVNDSGDCHVFHGTHVATTAAAPINNLGIVGVMPHADIYAIKLGYFREDSALGEPTDACGLYGDLAEAIRYAAGLPNITGATPPRPADVINMSLGGPQPSAALTQAVADARAAGVIVVAAAGNDGDTSSATRPSYPAATDGVIGVAATAFNNDRAYYSQFYPQVDIAAPGGDLRRDRNLDGRADGVLAGIASVDGRTFRADYAALQGTSMATPHVAAGFAMMRMIAPDITPQDIDNLLSNGDLTVDLGAEGQDDEFGHGLMSLKKMAQAALDFASDGVTPPPPPALIASPTRLDFGSALSEITLRVTRTGTGEIGVDRLSQEGLSLPTIGTDWIGFNEDTIDSNGLGTYSFVIDRSLLPEGVFTGRIFLEDTRGGEVSLPVSVYNRPVNASETGSSAPIYILVEKDDGAGLFENIEQIEATTGLGEEFTQSGLPSGRYRFVYGTDMDNDGFLCDAGELCGFYPLEATSFQGALDLTEDLSGLNLVVAEDDQIALTSFGGGKLPARPATQRRRLDLDE